PAVYGLQASRYASVASGLPSKPMHPRRFTHFSVREKVYRDGLSSVKKAILQRGDIVSRFAHSKRDSNCSALRMTLAPLRHCEKPECVRRVSRKGAKALRSQRFLESSAWAEQSQEDFEICALNRTRITQMRRIETDQIRIDQSHQFNLWFISPAKIEY